MCGLDSNFLKKYFSLPNFLRLQIMLGLMLCGEFASAGSYYVDADNGNDANSGASISTPWQTIAKVNGTQFVPGDTINFKCGQTWRETLYLKYSGTSNNPINYQSYTSNGSQCTSNPEIKGSNLVTGWTQYSNNIYAASVPINMVNISQIFVDGALMRLARHPNSGYWSIPITATSGGSCPAPYSSYIHAPISYIGSCSINLALASEHPEVQNNLFTGAGIHVQTVDYWIDDDKITGYDGVDTFLLSTKTRYAPRAGNNYFLDNELWMLDQAGEWYFDRTNRKVYVWLPDGTNPNTHVIEASVRSGITNGGLSVQFLTVQNLSVNQASLDGINVENAQNLIVSGTKVLNSRNAAISLYNTNTVTLQSNTLNNNGRDSIKIGAAPNTRIINNNIVNSGTPGFILGSPDTSLAAIFTDDTSANVTIDHNTITNAAYIGIRGAVGGTVSSNNITNTCTVLSDCGAIYIYGINQNLTNPNTLVNSNIITNIGASNGLLTAGIYLDDFANHVTVVNNIINNANWGIFLHLAHDNAILGNTVYGSHDHTFYISENISSSYDGVTKNNLVNGNIFFPKNNKESLFLYGEYTNQNFAKFDSNNYSGLYSDTVAVTKNGIYSFQGWKNTTSQDLHSKLFNYFKIASKRATSMLSGDYITNSTFDNNINGWSNWSTDGLAHRNFIQNCNANATSGGCQEVVAGNASGNLVSSNYVTLQENHNYQLKFTLLASGPVTAIVRRDGGAYENVGLQENIYGDGTWKSYTYIFQSTETLSNALFQFELNPSQTIRFDDVSLREVTAETNDPDDDTKIIVNLTDSINDYYCPDIDTTRCYQYVDLNNTPVTWPIKLYAHNSKIIIWTGNPFIINY